MAPTASSQTWDHRLNPDVFGEVRDSGVDGVPDSFTSGFRRILQTSSTQHFVVGEFSLSGLNAGSINRAVFATKLRMNNGTDELPLTLRIVAYDANGLEDLTDVTGTRSVLRTMQIDRLNPHRIAIDVTDLIKQRINAGEDYLGIRVEPVGTFPTSNDLSNRVEMSIYIDTSGTAGGANPSAPSGGPTAVVTGNTFRLRGTDNFDSFVIEKSGNNIVFKTENGPVHGSFNETSADQILVELYRGNDSLFVGPGVSLPITVYGHNGVDFIETGDGDDIVYGSNDTDVIFGNDGNDRLYGGDGADILNGGNGDDSLVGGFDNDALTGGSGSDRFLVRLESLDVITDDGPEDIVPWFTGRIDAPAPNLGFWSDEELEKMDEMFHILHGLVGTNAFLQALEEQDGAVWTVPLDFETTTGLIGGELVGSPTMLVSETWLNYPLSLRYKVMVHEMAHAHDHLVLETFTQLRGWVSKPDTTAGLFDPLQSFDTSWRAIGSEGHVSRYSTSNQKEDKADSFASHVLDVTQYPGTVTFLELDGMGNVDSGPPYITIDQAPQTQALMDDFLRYFAGDNLDNAVIWYEDFLGRADGNTSDTLTGGVSPNPLSFWSTDMSNIGVSSATHGVDNYQYRMSRTADQADENGYGIWESDAIEIWKHGNITVSFDIRTDGQLESSGPWNDYFIAEIVLDGTLVVPFWNADNQQLSGSYTTQSVTNAFFANYDELKVRFRWKTTGNDESYYVDNIVVSGTTLLSPLAALGSGTLNPGGGSTPPPPPPPFEMVIDVENFDTVYPGNREWIPASSGGRNYYKANGTGFRSNDNLTGEALGYNINVPAAGTYYVSVLMRGPSGSDDSIHVTEGTTPLTYGEFGLTGVNSWVWQDTVAGSRVQFTTSSGGNKEIRVYIREDGVEVDRIFIADSPTATPPAP
ncbi:MAG: hypothetical protein AAGI30_01030 [Planctomycetota bacterium]